MCKVGVTIVTIISWHGNYSCEAQTSDNSMRDIKVGCRLRRASWPCSVGQTSVSHSSADGKGSATEFSHKARADDLIMATTQHCLQHSQVAQMQSSLCQAAVVMRKRSCACEHFQHCFILGQKIHAYNTNRKQTSGERAWLSRSLTDPRQPGCLASEYTHTMSERKAVIKNADMSEDMQQDAIDCATQVTPQHHILSVRCSSCSMCSNLNITIGGQVDDRVLRRTGMHIRVNTDGL